MENKIAYQNAKPMLSVFLDGLKIAETFHLPGKVAKTKGFSKTASGAITYSIDGKKLLRVLDKLAAEGKLDEENLAKMKNNDLSVLTSLPLPPHTGTTERIRFHFDGLVFVYGAQRGR